MPSLLNATVGEYRLTDFLGAGGMGEVYRALHPKLGRTVAVKVLTNLDAKSVQRFVNEARIQARLRHDGIATLYDLLDYRGQPCIVMELVEGETLAQRLMRKGPLPIDETQRVFERVVEAVAYVHSQGVVHRDLKSNNIKITPAREVKLLDFGIARAPGTARLTQAGHLIGTAENFAPEQLQGREADYRSDIWALGVLLYEMLTGRLPFQTGTGDLYSRILNSECAQPSALNPAVPRSMDDVVMRCLRKKPGDRFQTAAELLRAAGRSEGAASVAMVGRKPLAIAAAVLVVIAAAGTIWMIGRDDGEGPPSPAPEVETALKQISVDVVEGVAEVYREGRLAGRTPFRISAQAGQRIELVLKRRGYQDLPVDFEASERRSYIYAMEPSAR